MTSTTVVRITLPSNDQLDVILGSADVKRLLSSGGYATTDDLAAGFTAVVSSLLTPEKRASVRYDVDVAILSAVLVERGLLTDWKELLDRLHQESRVFGSAGVLLKVLRDMIEEKLTAVEVKNRLSRFVRGWMKEWLVIMADAFAPESLQQWPALRRAVVASLGSDYEKRLALLISCLRA